MTAKHFFVIFILCISVVCVLISPTDYLLRLPTPIDSFVQSFPRTRKRRYYRNEPQNSQYKLIYFILDEHFNGKRRNMGLEDFINMQEQEIYENYLKWSYDYTLERQYAYDVLFPDFSISEMPSIWVEGYQGEKKFMTVSLQQKNFDHIWWTINQKDIKTVLVLQSKGLNLFWPTDVQEKKVDSFTIHLEHCRTLDDCTIYNLKYTHSREVKHVEVFYYKNWNCGENVPNNITTFVKFYNLYKKPDAQENTNVMVCCQNGTVACGVFIALDLAIKKLESDNIFDICWAVLGIRQCNKTFMCDLEQFRLVYNMAKYYIQNRDNDELLVYENVPSDPIYENI